MAKLNKEKFMKTQVGSSMAECITAWDKALDERKKHEYFEEEYKRAEKTARWCQAQWEVYQMVLLQFFGADYHFSRTDEFFGICTEDGADWLVKVEK